MCKKRPVVAGLFFVAQIWKKMELFGENADNYSGFYLKIHEKMADFQL